MIIIFTHEQACAHRYSHNYSFVNFDEIAMFGACYSFNNDLIQENKVCLNDN